MTPPLIEQAGLAVPEPDPAADTSEAKAGSSIATLWLKVNQDDQPASIPSTLVSLENCPQCNQQLAAPLKSSGRQVCVKCGWSNKPRNLNATPTTDTADPELLRLLEQAASESLENMKPRKKR